MNHLLAVEKTTETRGLINNSLRKIPDKQQDSYCVPVTPHYYCIHRRFDSFLQKKNVRIVSIWHTVTWIIQTISKAFTKRTGHPICLFWRIRLNLCVLGKERWSPNFNPPCLSVVYFLYFHCDILIKMVII